jgi:Family of unknown function (DUF5522)
MSEYFCRIDKSHPLYDKIKEAHDLSIKNNERVYKDPLTGYNAINQKTLEDRKECCNKQCRHCPYGS